MAKATFKFDLAETFPHLSHPPIVEATIHWQARSQRPLEPESLRSALAQRLPEYESCAPIQRIAFAARTTEDSATLDVQHQKGWHGYRLTSDEGRNVVQFDRDGVAFSRTQQYQDWQQFAAAALPVWRAFLEIASPVEIQRLGVRFINHISTATPQSLGDYLRDPPTCPSSLPLSDFVYQSTFAVPDQHYGIRVIKVMQPSVPEFAQSSGLYLDCDVYTTKPISCSDAEVDRALLDMRWLKNKIFFSLLTEQAVQTLK